MNSLKVFFGTTTKELIKYKDFYFSIRQNLIDLNCVILDDWLPKAYEYKVKNPTGERSKKKNYAAIIDAINRCDFVVVDYSVPNFSSSHQIIHATVRRKPVLVLRLEKDNSFKDSYMEWLESEFLTIKDYDLNNLSKILREFIGQVEIGYGFKRYNLVLEAKHKYFLDWANENYKKSRSEMTRLALDKLIEDDENYKKYLRN